MYYNKIMNWNTNPVCIFLMYIVERQATTASSISAAQTSLSAFSFECTAFDMHTSLYCDDLRSKSFLAFIDRVKPFL